MGGKRVGEQRVGDRRGRRRGVTMVAAGGLALALSAAPAAAQYGPIDQPDAQIRPGRIPSFVGDNIYNTNGQNQRANRTGLRRNNGTARFAIRLENDGAFADTIRVEAPASTRHFRVRYFFGGVDVTRQVIAGRFRVPLGPGESRVLRVEVTTRNAPPGRNRNLLINSFSQNDPAQRDTVRANVRVR